MLNATSISQASEAAQAVAGRPDALEKKRISLWIPLVNSDVVVGNDCLHASGALGGIELDDSARWIWKANRSIAKCRVSF